MVGIRRFLVIVVLAFIAGGCSSKSHNTSGLDRMGHPEWVPYLLPDGTITKQCSSYDLSGGNDDGNYVNAFVRYREPSGEVVIFDECGPGCLYRQQINIWREWKKEIQFFPPYNNAGKSRIRYYFDNEKTPRIDMTAEELFSGKTPPFDAPFTFMDDARYGSKYFSKLFANTYYPLPFKTRLKITFTTNDDWSRRWNTWYQFTYLAFPTAEGVTTWTGPNQDTQKIRRQWSNLGSDPKPTAGNVNFDSRQTVPPGQTQTVFNHKGQGSIAALKFKIEPFDQDTFFNTNIMVYWDDEASPSVSMPLGYFFGGGGKDFSFAAQIPRKILKNLFYGFDCNEGSFYNYWPMPFWSHARIEIQNQSTKTISLSTHIELKADKKLYPKKESGYFYAKRTVDHDSNGLGSFCNVFNETGRGQVAAINFFTDHYSMDGDEFTYIDSSRTPQIHGNGTEDDHNQGWGGSRYQMPLWGGLLNGYQAAYRIYMNEPYIFYDNIKINYDYAIINGTKDSKSDVVMFYYKSARKDGLKLTDELDVGNESSERSHNYRIISQTWEKTITSCYDGYDKKRDQDCMTDAGRAFNGCSEFTVAINPANNGILIRKRISRFENGLQTATVYVDGKKVTERPWHIVQPSTAPANQVWLDSDFQIPASYTKGKKSIKLRMEYAGSNKGEINEFYYWIYSLGPQ